jgi:hypothetical protein
MATDTEGRREILGVPAAAPMTQTEWRAEVERRFGPDPMGWRFRCCMCGTESTPADFKARGAEPQRAAHECIGRLELERRQPDGLVPDLGCDWHANGCFRAASVIEVTFPDGTSSFAMPFAEAT